MSLPRFTGGSVGKLTFDHLNDAFESIDAIERDAGTAVPSQMRRGRTVVAKILSKNADEYAWQEVARSGTAFAAVPDGLTSLESGSLYAYPIVATGQGDIPVNSVVVIAPQYDLTGKLYYVSISPPAAGTSMIGIVQGVSSTVTQNQRWLYNVNEVYFNVNSYTAVPGGRSVIANNGCENAVDAPQNIGVGQATGIAQNLVRRPIKSGTVVTLVQDAVISSQYTFSIPNGYEFTCP